MKNWNNMRYFLEEIYYFFAELFDAIKYSFVKEQPWKYDLGEYSAELIGERDEVIDCGDFGVCCRHWYDYKLTTYRRDQPIFISTIHKFKPTIKIVAYEVKETK